VDLWGRPEYLEIGEQLRKRLHAEWDPEFCLAESARKRAAGDDVVAWAEANQPEAPYYLAPPDVDHECFINTYDERIP
jgi:hypothetical protein